MFIHGDGRSVVWNGQTVDPKTAPLIRTITSWTVLPHLNTDVRGDRICLGKGIRLLCCPCSCKLDDGWGACFEVRKGRIQLFVGLDDNSGGSRGCEDICQCRTSPAEWGEATMFIIILESWILSTLGAPSSPRG